MTRKNFTNITESVLDKNAGVNFDVVNATAEFKSALKKYAGMKIPRMMPLEYRKDEVDGDFENVLVNLYRQTLKDYISSKIPAELGAGSVCQVILDTSKPGFPKLTIGWFTDNPRTYNHLLIGTRYPTDNFICELEEMKGRTMACTSNCKEAAYLPVEFAKEISDFFKYKIVK